MTAADPLVTVCRDPRDHARARVRLSALSGFAFDSFSHGCRSKFSRPMLVAFLAPADIVDGTLHHPVSHGIVPDRMRVAITRTHNQTLYPILERSAAAARIAERAPLPRVRMRLDAPAIPERPRATEPQSRSDDVPALRLHVPKALDVAAIRRRTGLSRPAFSVRIGVALSTLQNWEDGRHAPEGTARVLLAMVDRNPCVIEQTLKVVA